MSGKYTMLTADEEKDLIARGQAGDRQARDRVIAAHLPLALKLAGRAAGGRKDLFDDMLGAAQLEIVKLFDIFDPQHGMRFCTFVMTRAPYALVRERRGVIRHGLSNCSNKLLPMIARARRMSEDAAWVPGTPVPAELRRRMRERFGLDEKGVDDLLIAAMSSFESTSGTRDLPCAGPSAEDGACSAEAREMLHRIIDEMEPRMADIMRSRLDADPATLQELADRWSISKERVRQIEVKGAEILTKRMRAALAPKAAMAA